MHELSIATGIVDAVLAEAEARALATVTTVYLRLGPLSGVDRDALLFAFPMACEGTRLEGAQLVVEPVALRIACEVCATEGTPSSLYEHACPGCGATSTRVVAGNELEVRAFEACEEVQA